MNGRGNHHCSHSPRTGSMDPIHHLITPKQRHANDAGHCAQECVNSDRKHDEYESFPPNDAEEERWESHNEAAESTGLDGRDYGRRVAGVVCGVEDGLACY